MTMRSSRISGFQGDERTRTAVCELSSSYRYDRLAQVAALVERDRRVLSRETAVWLLTRLGTKA